MWRRVKARQEEIACKSTAVRAAVHANARTGRGPKYLFSGLLVCGACGGKYVIVDQQRYGCSTWLYRGISVCQNTVKVSRTLVETLLLEGIKGDLFTEEALDVFKKETARLLAERRHAASPDFAQTKTRLAQVEQQIANMLTAIKDGFRSDSLKTEMEEAEQERTRLQGRLNDDVKRLEKVTSFLPKVADRFKALVTHLGTVSQQQVDSARGILKELVGPQIPLHPTANGEERYLTAHLSGQYAGLKRLLLGQNKFGGGHARPRSTAW